MDVRDKSFPWTHYAVVAFSFGTDRKLKMEKKCDLHKITNTFTGIHQYHCMMLSDFHSGGGVLVLCEELGQCDHKSSRLYCHGDFPLRILPAMHFRALVKPPDKAKLNAGGVTTVLTT